MKKVKLEDKIKQLLDKANKVFDIDTSDAYIDFAVNICDSWDSCSFQCSLMKEDKNDYSSTTTKLVSTDFIADGDSILQCIKELNDALDNYVRDESKETIFVNDVKYMKVEE